MAGPILALFWLLVACLGAGCGLALIVGTGGRI